MKKLILLTLLVVAGAVIAANYVTYQGTTTHSATTASGTANKRDSTDIWIGRTEGYATALTAVFISEPYISGVGTTRLNDTIGLGNVDSALIRILTKSEKFPTATVRSSAIALMSGNRVLFNDTLANDTTFKGLIGIRVITADTCSDTTLTGITYRIDYEVTLK